MGHSDLNNPFEISHQWLRPEEIFEILNSRRPLLTSNIKRPQSGSLFLFDREALRNFRKDGYDWEKTRNGDKVNENHTTLKLKDRSDVCIPCYTARRKDNKNFRRRCYWMGNSKRIVLVHYLEEGNKRTNSESGQVAPNPEVDNEWKSCTQMSPKATDKWASVNPGDSPNFPTGGLDASFPCSLDDFDWTALLTSDDPTNQQPFGNTENEAAYTTKGNGKEPTIVVQAEERMPTSPFNMCPAKKHKSNTSSSSALKDCEDFLAAAKNAIASSTTSTSKSSSITQAKATVQAFLGKEYGTFANETKRVQFRAAIQTLIDSHFFPTQYETTIQAFLDQHDNQMISPYLDVMNQYNAGQDLDDQILKATTFLDANVRACREKEKDIHEFTKRTIAEIDNIMKNCQPIRSQLEECLKHKTNFAKEEGSLKASLDNGEQFWNSFKNRLHKLMLP